MTNMTVTSKNQADESFMRLAIEQATYAASINEIAVGCVIVMAQKVIATGYNSRERDKNPLGHAEIMAILAAAAALDGWRLDGCTLYVTLEPCPMCMGAIINARINRVVYGAYDPVSGCAGSLIQLAACDFTHRPIVKGGVLEGDCKHQLSSFFNRLRT